jgi:hypothetical protein
MGEPWKIQRILDWPVPQSIKYARLFIVIAVYYCIFILDFAIIASPIFAFFQKGKRFIRTDEYQTAMDILKTKIAELPAATCIAIRPRRGLFPDRNNISDEFMFHRKTSFAVFTSL